MDKAEFIERLTKQFRFIITEAKPHTAEIEGQRGRLDHTGFVEWLRKEQAAAAAEPALKIFDRFFLKTPERAAQRLAAMIDDADFGGKTDWSEQWQQAQQATGFPDKVNTWKHRALFAQYAKAFWADTRARSFAQYLEQSTKVQPEKKENVKFWSEEKKIEFFNLARQCGIIGEKGEYIKQRNKELNLAAFWRIVKDAGLVDTNDIYDGPAVFEMANLLGTKTGKNTGNKFPDREIQDAVKAMKKRE